MYWGSWPPLLLSCPFRLSRPLRCAPPLRRLSSRRLWVGGFLKSRVGRGRRMRARQEWSAANANKHEQSRCLPRGGESCPLLWCQERKFSFSFFCVPVVAADPTSLPQKPSRRLSRALLFSAAGSATEREVGVSLVVCCGCCCLVVACWIYHTSRPARSVPPAPFPWLWALTPKPGRARG
jgi:hypothetical protein